MSVSNQTDKIYGNGNGSTTVFSFPFKIFDATQLVVYLINTATGVVTGPLVLNTDYTVSINSVTEGGSITFTVAPATGYQWFVKRVVPYTQSAVIPTEGPLPGLQISNQLDLMTMMIIQDQEAISRCLQAPVTFTGATLALPSPVAYGILSWNSLANAIVNLGFPAPSANQVLAWDPTGAFLINTTASAQGPTGATGPTGPTGATGPGVPNGGTTGQVLVKNSNTNQDTAWAGYAIPSGGIIMWSGSIASIPTGWVLCNGSNGTPDLRNRFIVAADADVGGVAKSTVTGAAAQTGEGQLPATTLQTFTASKFFNNTSPAFSIGGDGTNNFLTYTPSFGTGTANVARFYALAYIMKT